MASMKGLDRAQTQAMELLLQQCGPIRYECHSAEASPRENAAANATLLDLLAQICADANTAVQELSVDEVTSKLASAVSATQESLRSIGENVSTILQDPEQMRELCYHVTQADAKMSEALQKSQMLMDNDGLEKSDEALVTHRDARSVLVFSSDEKNVHNVMVLVENMCTMVDHAMSTITQDELAIAAQLSLGIAQRLLDAGQSLFTSLGDEERRKGLASDRSDHITIEEVVEEQDGKKGSSLKSNDQQSEAKRSKQLRRAAVLRTSLKDLYHRTREQAVDHPFLTGALTAAIFPFIGLAIPMACMVAVALLFEKYYPEHTKLTLELCSNFIQMSKLWFLLLKIGVRQISVVAKEIFRSWYKHASENGFMATGVELASTGCSIGVLGLSYMYQIALGFTKQALGNESG